jgi:hypothetical protein
MVVFLPAKRGRGLWRRSHPCKTQSPAVRRSWILKARLSLLCLLFAPPRLAKDQAELKNGKDSLKGEEAGLAAVKVSGGRLLAWGVGRALHGSGWVRMPGPALPVIQYAFLRQAARAAAASCSASRHMCDVQCQGYDLASRSQ